MTEGGTCLDEYFIDVDSLRTKESGWNITNPGELKDLADNIESEMRGHCDE